MSTLFTLLLALVSLIPAGATEDKSAWELPDLEGKAHVVLPSEPRKAAVLFFVSPYCPTANTFTSEINRISTDYDGKAAFYLVHTDPDIKVTDALQHSVMFKIKAAVLLDTSHKLVKRLQARITPEAVVIGPDGKILYQGRINDLYLGPTKRQRQATTHELRDALDAVLAGKPVAVPKTEAMGCKISVK